MIVLFDVDGTLTEGFDGARLSPVGEAALNAVGINGEVWVWSAQGREYARAVTRRHKLMVDAWFTKPNMSGGPMNVASALRELHKLPDLQIDNDIVDRIPGVPFLLAL